MIDKTANQTTRSSKMSEVGYEKTVSHPCHCGSDAKLSGFFSNGSAIHDPYMDYTYTPEDGELLKIHHIKCETCKNEQWS